MGRLRNAEQTGEHSHRELPREVAHEVGAAERGEAVDHLVRSRLDKRILPAVNRFRPERVTGQPTHALMADAVHLEDRLPKERPHQLAVDPGGEGVLLAQHPLAIFVPVNAEYRGVEVGLVDHARIAALRVPRVRVAQVAVVLDDGVEQLFDERSLWRHRCPSSV